MRCVLCRSMEEDSASPRGEPAKAGGLARSKWVMAAVAVAAIGVALYTFRDTFLAGSVNARLLSVYGLVCQVGLPLYHLACGVSMQAAACEDWLRSAHRRCDTGELCCVLGIMTLHTTDPACCSHTVHADWLGLSTAQLFVLACHPNE